MRRWIGLLALFLPGCPSPYGVRMTIHVPMDVQAKFSAAQPGLVMNDISALVLLCEPTDEPLTFVTWPETGLMRCEQPGNLPFTIYAFQLGPTDLQSLTPLQTMFMTCGKSSKISDGGTINALADLVQKNGLGASGRVASASGEGACDTSGDWSVDMTLSLSP
jgi:hypothetical protein